MTFYGDWRGNEVNALTLIIQLTPVLFNDMYPLNFEHSFRIFEHYWKQVRLKKKKGITMKNIVIEVIKLIKKFTNIIRALQHLKDLLKVIKKKGINFLL